MNQIQQNSAPKKRLAGIAAAIVVILTVGFFVTPGSEAVPPLPIGEEGPWINANAYECGAGAVCAEWPNYDANTVTICCIDPGLVGSYAGIGNNCETYFGEFVR